MNRNPFITLIVVGVPGVGKTTVLNHLIKLAEKEGIRIEIVNMGDYMFKAAKEKGLVTHRDELRRLELRKQLELQGHAAKLIVKDAINRLDEKSVLIVDTHAVIRTTTGYWPGLPKHVIEELKPDSIVIVEAPVEDIVARQLRDKTRYRSDLAKKEVVEELLTFTRVAAMSSATFTASSVKIVLNLEGKPEEAAREILDTIKKLR